MTKIIFAILLFFTINSSLIAKEDFILNSIEEAKTLSKITEKPILLIFGAGYCSYCGSLKTNILNLDLSPEIDEYIVCYIDIEIYVDLKKQHSVSVIPDSRIIINNQQKRSLIGYNQKKYRNWLKND
jgi:thioredoxin-related protein